MPTNRTFGAMLNEVAMPFKSEAQRSFMYSQHPDIAKRWRQESGPQKNLPPKVNVWAKMSKEKK